MKSLLLILSLVCLLAIGCGKEALATDYAFQQQVVEYQFIQPQIVQQVVEYQACPAIIQQRVVQKNVVQRNVVQRQKSFQRSNSFSFQSLNVSSGGRSRSRSVQRSSFR